MGWSMPGYVELKDLGKGASGRVVLAEHQATGTKVAIKYLADHLSGDPGFVAGAGYGPDWEREGRGSLARRAALLLLLSPVAGSAVGGTGLTQTLLGASKVTNLVVAGGLAVGLTAGGLFWYDRSQSVPAETAVIQTTVAPSATADPLSLTPSATADAGLSATPAPVATTSTIASPGTPKPASPTPGTSRSPSPNPTTPMPPSPNPTTSISRTMAQRG